MRKFMRRYVCVFIVMMTIFTTTSVYAGEDVYEEIQHSVISKNMFTGEVYEEPETNMQRSINNLEYTDAYIPENVNPLKNGRSIVHNTDERIRITNTSVFPYSAICYLRTVWPNGSDTVGTAWMYGPKVAMTAGHCVYDSSRGGWAVSIEIHPGINGSTTNSSGYIASVIHTDKKYSSSENENYDWGLLEFTTDIGNKTGYFGAQYYASSQVGKSITITGYPGEKNKQMWTESGTVAGWGTSRISYMIDTTPGQSGSPVYEYSSNNYRSMAIHVSSCLLYTSPSPRD